MTAHKIDNMASRFPESLSKAQILEIKEINIHTESDEIFQGKVLFLNILRLNFTREAELVTLTRNNCQLRVCLQLSKHGIKIQRL